MLFAYQVGAEFGKLSFAKAGKAVAKLFGSDEPKDGIPQKLHLLVVTHTGTACRLQGLQFARLGAVGQGLRQQLRPLEAMSQGRLQQRNVTRLHDLEERPRTPDPRKSVRSGVRGLRSEVRSLVLRCRILRTRRRFWGRSGASGQLYQAIPFIA